MTKLIDLTGEKIGHLTVVKQTISNTKNHTKWICKCDCGNFVEVSSCNLRTGRTNSCGCLRVIQGKKNGEKSKTHGMTNTRIYSIYRSMKERCYRTKHMHYKNYGGRGIVICDEWLDDFMSFCDWAIKNGYSDDLSIDRIDNNKGYSPDNCQWITSRGQNQNRRDSITLDNGMNASEFSRIYNIPRSTINLYIKIGLTTDQMINRRLESKCHVKLL